MTGREFWHFYQWAPGWKSEAITKLEEVFVDDEWQAESIPKLKAFYQEYLEELKNPEPHLEPKRVEIDTPEAHNLLTEYDELAEAVDNAKERQKEILERLVELAKGRNAEIDGRKLTQVERKGNVQYAKVMKEHLPKLDLEPYRGKGSTFWKLS